MKKLILLFLVFTSCTAPGRRVAPQVEAYPAIPIVRHGVEPPKYDGRGKVKPVYRDTNIYESSSYRYPAPLPPDQYRR